MKRSQRSVTPLGAGRHIGLSLAGGKADKSAVAVIEFFPEQNRLAVLSVHSKFDSLETREEKKLAHPDSVLIDRLIALSADAKTLTLDVPLSLPKCVECEKQCPGFSACEVPEVEWLRTQNQKRLSENRNAKWSTPYTERAAEYYLSTSLEERFFPSQALGANMAPLALRARFLKRLYQASAPKDRRDLEWKECSTRVSLWRIGRSLLVAKSHLRHHKHAIGSDESRSVFLDAMIAGGQLFVYSQDRQVLIDDPPSFDALIAALTGFLSHQKQTEVRPKGYPKSSGWPEIPLLDCKFGQ